MRRSSRRLALLLVRSQCLSWRRQLGHLPPYVLFLKSSRPMSPNPSIGVVHLRVVDLIRRDETWPFHEVPSHTTRPPFRVL